MTHRGFVMAEISKVLTEQITHHNKLTGAEPQVPDPYKRR